MKLVLTLLVRDEEDILVENLEYHLNRGVDFVVATDNRSIDGTREILEAYRRLGCLHYIFEPQDDYAQSEWVTRMARLAGSELGADWVINGDADEFWWPERARDLKEVLQRVPASVSGVRVRRHNFVPSERTSDVGFVRAMVHREAVSVNGLGQPLAPKVCHRASACVTVEQGNHAIRAEGAELRIDDTDELCVLHYPLRTFAQFRNKIDKGGAAYARSRLPPEVGHVWRFLHRELGAGRLEAFYRERLLEAEALGEALASGALVEDRRLRTYFDETGLARRAGAATGLPGRRPGEADSPGRERLRT